MRILIIMDPGIIVPVKGYGGHERLVEMFAKEYLSMGHQVHLLITSGSAIAGCIIHDFGKEGFPPSKKDALKAIPQAWKFLWSHKNDFNLVHNFGRLAYLLPILNHPVKKIMTYGREITNRNIRFINFLNNKNIFFTACSANLLSRIDAQGKWDVVYNAIKFAKYNIKAKVAADAPLIFLGRIEKVKGCHTAIRIAKDTRNRLIIAGNISPLREEAAYFENEIKPHIDNKQIMYMGVLNDAQKNHYLGTSKALIFPIEWNEPFGIVMIEAMACGTPVIGFDVGSVSEVIDEGITGFKVNDFCGMVEAIKRIDTIDRKNCAEHAKKRFDVSIIALKYIRLITAEKKKIVIVTTGQPAANPRVIKEYQALKQHGCDVKVLYTYSAEWSHEIDEEKFSSGKLVKDDFILIGGDPFKRKFSYFMSRLYFKILSNLAKVLRLSVLKEITIARSSLYLRLSTSKYEADVYMAHYLGALPAAIKAASKNGSAVIFDAEDFHRGEEPYYPSHTRDVIAMEDKLIPGVDIITTASPLISNYYQQLYPGKRVVTINNVFSKDYLQPDKNHENQHLKLFWFSQNIGPNRGLEVIIDAFNRIDKHISLTLLGNVRNKEYLQQLLRRSRYPDRIHLIGPVKPERIFDIAADHDIGLAAEIPYCTNRDICLTNKIFTYLLAGNCVLASDTLAQKDFINTNNKVGLIYKHNDAADLSALIEYLNDNRDLLRECKTNSRKIAGQQFNWETESKKLITIIDSLEPLNG